MLTGVGLQVALHYQVADIHRVQERVYPAAASRAAKRAKGTRRGLGAGVARPAPAPLGAWPAVGPRTVIRAGLLATGRAPAACRALVWV